MKAHKLLFLLPLFILACNGNKQKRVESLFDQGKELEALSLPDSAIIIYQQAINELKDTKEDTFSGVLYNRIGDLMFANALRSEAFESYQKALSFNLHMSNKTETSKSFRGMGKSMLLQTLNDSAITYFNKALSLTSQIQDKEEISLIHNNLSFAYYELENYEQSLFHNLKALQLSSDSINIYKNYNIRGDLFMQAKQYDSAYIYLKLGCNSKTIATQATCYQSLAQLAKNTNNKDSIQYTNIYYILKDSIEKNNKSSNIFKKDKQYVLEKTRKEEKSKFIYQIIGILALCLSIIFLFINRHHREKKRNKELSKFVRNLQVEMAKLECKLALAKEKEEIQQELALGKQLQSVHETVIKEMMKLGDKLSADFRKTDMYSELKEKLKAENGAQLKERERNAFRRKLLEAFRPLTIYLVTFLDFSPEDCLYCYLSLLKFKTNECAVCRNITEDAIRSQKRRLKIKINLVFKSDMLFDYIFMKIK